MSSRPSPFQSPTTGIEPGVPNWKMPALAVAGFRAVRSDQVAVRRVEDAEVVLAVAVPVAHDGLVAGCFELKPTFDRPGGSCVAKNEGIGQGVERAHAGRGHVTLFEVFKPKGTGTAKASSRVCHGSTCVVRAAGTLASCGRIDEKVVRASG